MLNQLKTTKPNEQAASKLSSLNGPDIGATVAAADSAMDRIAAEAKAQLKREREERERSKRGCCGCGC